MKIIWYSFDVAKEGSQQSTIYEYTCSHCKKKNVSYLVSYIARGSTLMVYSISNALFSAGCCQSRSQFVRHLTLHAHSLCLENMKPK